MTPRERLQVMFYILTRDHLPVGVLDSILREHVTKVETSKLLPSFSNGHLAAYAREFADVLLDEVRD